MLIGFPNKMEACRWASHFRQKWCFRPHWTQHRVQKCYYVVLREVKLSCGGKAGSRPRLIFSHSGLPLCKLHCGVNKHIDRPVSGNVEHKGEKKTSVHEEKSLIGKFERKGVLQAVWDTSRENKGSERFRQTLQTGTLPGVFQPNVFKCILLITKL